MGGNYFGDNKPDEKEEKKVELIDNVRDLLSAYNKVLMQVQETTNQGYNAILPIKTELFGDPNSATEIGKIGEIRHELKSTRLVRTTVGMTMWNSLEGIEQLDNWSERYSSYLEKHIDSMKFINLSGFGIIKNQTNIIMELKQKIETLNHQIDDTLVRGPLVEATRAAERITESQVTTEEEADIQNENVKWERFKLNVQERMEKYSNSYHCGNKRTVSANRAFVFQLIRKDPKRREYIEAQFANFEPPEQDNKL